MATLVRAVSVTLQNEEETERDNVYIQTIIDMEVIRGERRRLPNWKGLKSLHLTGTLTVDALRWLLERKVECLWECR